MDTLVLLAVGLLGGGAFASIVVALLNRRKTSAETEGVSVTAAEGAVRIQEATMHRLEIEIERLNKMAETERARGDQFASNERQCRAELDSLTARYAGMAADLAAQKAINEQLADRVGKVEGKATESIQVASDLADKVAYIEQQVAVGPVIQPTSAVDPFGGDE